MYAKTVNMIKQASVVRLVLRVLPKTAKSLPNALTTDNARLGVKQNSGEAIPILTRHTPVINPAQMVVKINYAMRKLVHAKPQHVWATLKTPQIAKHPK